MSKEEKIMKYNRRHVVFKSKIKKGKIIHSKDLSLKDQLKKPIKDLKWLLAKKLREKQLTSL